MKGKHSIYEISDGLYLNMTLVCFIYIFKWREEEKVLR